jgi:hypothetical protein
MDWQSWHDRYDSSAELAARLQLVQAQITTCLDSLPPGPVQVISVCAGDGRDLVGALCDHRRAPDVRARLVEREGELVELGKRTAATAGLSGRVEFVAADATTSTPYVGMAPADLVLACGVLGNVRETDLAELVGNLRALCRPGGFLVWTHHRRTIEGRRLTELIRGLLGAARFEPVTYHVTPEGTSGVSTHRYGGGIVPLRPEQPLFRFTGFDRIPGRRWRPETG